MRPIHYMTCVCIITNMNVISYGQQEEKLLQQTKGWADHLGAELWHFGDVVTRRNMVMEKYKSANIVLKNGDNLTTEIADRIREMLEKKTAAVQRIMDAAGELATSSSNDKVDYNFQYYNAKELINNLTNPPPKPKIVEEKVPKTDEYKTSDTLKALESFESEEYLKDDGFGMDESGDEADTPLDEVAKEVIHVSDGANLPLQPQPQEDKTRLNLTVNPNFFNIPVNTEHSAVHVPSNVYDRSKEVIQGIKWSENLDNIFKNNYRDDPSLTWQYFGSSSGFLRQFPAMVWHQIPTDSYDCRTRSWYIEAASSPKDVVILVDRSGSMTGKEYFMLLQKTEGVVKKKKGMQKEIAKHVVNNLLDTLGNNDYVNIFTFSNVTEPLVPCFNDTLVQANLANVRELKENMDSFKTENIANFTDALTTAFLLLENYRIGSRNKSGAGCNQAIMLITDGVQYNYKELFQDYNWRELPYKPVRVFTYLIGREVSDVREVKWMACANQGYYVHLSTFAEVREQVLHYIPVMARPMVLWAAKPQPTWSSVYADVTDPKLTNWLWTQRQRHDQKERFLAHRRHPYQKHNIDEPYKAQHFSNMQQYQLMTSISMPVYDRRPNANITEHILVRESHWKTIIRETRVANLLGVAGTDVPIQYIRQLMKPHLIGVNGYAFVITNNGYILTHPDLRPVFEGILKPAYNRVDMAEVELPDDQSEPREFNRSLLDLRKDVLYKRTGHYVLKMKYHLDDMKRLIRGRRHFYYKNITGTPFSLVVVIPDQYGRFAVQQTLQQDIHRQVVTKNDFLKYFGGNKWKIHPEWVYCKYLGGNLKFNTPEQELLHFFNRMLHEPWKWSLKNAPCDRDIVHSLVFDAKITNFFDQNITTTADDKKGHEMMKRYRVTIAFIATYSGLTRWQDFPQNILPTDENKTTLHFSDIHNRAIDEVWYRRAVEQYSVEEESFVYSVPFDVESNGNMDDILVTASHAIFLTKNATHRTPAAVVGYQFYHTALQILFFRNITNGTCDNDADYACYILDNNAYIILAEQREHTGKWFGEVEPMVMRMLVEKLVYLRVPIFDYQAVCFPEKEEHSRASFRLHTPFNHFMQLVHWFLSTVLYMCKLALAHTNMNDLNTILDRYESTSESVIVSNQPPTKQNEKEFDKKILITKTKPTPCDERRHLHELSSTTGFFNMRMHKEEQPFIVQRVPNSNLILVVVYSVYKESDMEEDGLEGPKPEPISYNMSLPCRMREDDLPRKKYAKCINRHTNESKIELCGGATPRFSISSTSVILLCTAAAVFRFM